MTGVNITPATKPQHVVIYGAIVAALTTVISGLTVLFKDDPTMILILGVAGVIVSGAAVFKDQLVKAQVVAYSDTAAYFNDDRKLIAGPASTMATGSAAIVVPRGSVTTDPETYEPRPSGGPSISPPTGRSMSATRPSSVSRSLASWQPVC
jgi:hypothetical protein